uniref:DNA helicase n=1 Tax=Globodera pallida TaxID=36090 RepID=A0A183BQE8_GLOPA
MLHNEMRVHQIGTGTTKRQILIQTLQNVQTVFGTVHNELDMLDLLDSSSIVKENLDKLEQLLKLNIVKNGMPNDDVELSEEILSCFDTGEIEKRIQKEGDYLVNRQLLISFMH